MKKIISILTAAVMLLSLSACNKSEKEQDIVSDTKIMETTAKEQDGYYSDSFISVRQNNSVLEYNGYLYYLSGGQLRCCKTDLSNDECINKQVESFRIINSTLFFTVKRKKGSISLYARNLNEENPKNTVIYRTPENETFYHYTQTMAYGDYIFVWAYDDTFHHYDNNMSTETKMIMLDKDGKTLRTFEDISNIDVSFKNENMYIYTEYTNCIRKFNLNDPYNMKTETINLPDNISYFSYTGGYITYRVDRQSYEFINPDNLSSDRIKLDFSTDSRTCAADILFSTDEYIYFDVMYYTSTAVGNSNDCGIYRIKPGETKPEFISNITFLNGQYNSPVCASADGTLYYKDYEDNKIKKLQTIFFDTPTKDNLKFSIDKEDISENFSDASSITEYGDYIYYSNSDGINRCKKDLTNNRIISNNSCDRFSIYNSYLYYLEYSKQYNLYRINLDDENPKKELVCRLSDNPFGAFYSPVVYGNYIFCKIIYGNDSGFAIFDFDGHLLTYNLLNSSRFGIIGNSLYYSEIDYYNYTHYIKKLSLDNLNKKPETVYTVSDEQQHRKSAHFAGRNILIKDCEDTNSFQCVKIDDNSSVDINFDSLCDNPDAYTRYKCCDSEYMYFSLYYNNNLKEENSFANTIYRVRFGESTPEYVTDTEYNSSKLVSENGKMYFTDFDGNLTVN